MAYYLGNGFTANPTRAPTHGPTHSLRPVPSPTLAPTHPLTHAPTHLGGGGGGGKGGGGDDGDDAAAAQSASTSAALGITFGLLALLAVCGGGLSYAAKQGGYPGAAALIADKLRAVGILPDAYAPMGDHATAAGRGGGGMTFNALRDEVGPLGQRGGGGASGRGGAAHRGRHPRCQLPSVV